MKNLPKASANIEQPSFVSWRVIELVTDSRSPIAVLPVNLR